MTAIRSADNARYRAWLRLATQPRAVRESGRTLAEGVHLAQSALATDYPVEAVLLKEGAQTAELAAVLAALRARPVPVFELAPGLYRRLEPVEHGVGLTLVLPVGRQRAPAPGGDALYLDGVQDPGNAGALLRVAAAAGVRTVIAAPGSASLWAPRVLRAAQGAHFALALHEEVGPAQLAGLFAGPWYGADAREAASLWDVRFDAGPVGWMFGAEGRGLSSEARAWCRQRVRIDIDPAVESLNVASAAAVCLFERRRQSNAGR